MAKGFSQLTPELTKWLQEFPDKGFIALALEPDLINKAIEQGLINTSPPYKLTSKGLRIKDWLLLEG
jgi:hypothetical protein